MKPAKTGESITSSELPAARKLPCFTGKDLLQSGLVGMWKKRGDIRNSTAFARRLRTRTSRRANS